MRNILFIVILFAAKVSWAIQVPEFLTDVTAKSWLVADENNKIIGSKDTETVRSIASITKLMTAMVVLKAGLNLNQQIPYSKGVLLTRKQLLEISIVRSDNHAANLLCHSYYGGYKKCVEAMNLLAWEYGMLHTTFVDSTGLLAGNTSTAQDLLVLLNRAEEFPLIVESSAKTKVEIKIKKKWLVFKNTNPLVGRNHEFIITKTGTTSAAGGCIVFTAKTDTGIRRVVVLGSKNGRTRIPEAEFIFENVKE